MGFSEAVRVCLRKYVTFSGRATRPEYWYFILFVLLGGVVFGVLDYMLFGGTVTTTENGFSAQSDGPLTSLFNLLVFIPILAAGWRRMHDTGRSGLYLLYPLIVSVGVATFLTFWVGAAQLMSGDIGAVVAGGGGLIALVAMLVLFVSPLMVLWWLTRPSQPGANAFDS